MVERNGLRLVIELTAAEAGVFRRIAKTDDQDFYDGIAKALVLGVQEIVEPQFVYENIELLVAIHEFGVRGDLRAEQEWADTLSYTREQLEKQSVKDAITSWAVFFGDTIEEIAGARWTNHVDQLRWAQLNAVASSLVDILRATILRHL